MIWPLYLILQMGSPEFMRWINSFFWHTRHILAIFLAALLAYFIIKYLASRMGQKVTGVGMSIPSDKAFIYFRDNLGALPEKFVEMDKDVSCFPIGWGVGFCRL